MSDLVENPDARFSYIVAHFVPVLQLQVKGLVHKEKSSMQCIPLEF